MILSSVAGCSYSGPITGCAAPREIGHPTPEELQCIPEDTPVRVELLSGRIVEGVYLSYSPAEASVNFRMEQVEYILSDEFTGDGGLYRIPEGKIITLTVLEPPKHGKMAGAVVMVTVLLAGGLAFFAHAMSGLN